MKQRRELRRARIGKPRQIQRDERHQDLADVAHFSFSAKEKGQQARSARKRKQPKRAPAKQAAHEMRAHQEQRPQKSCEDGVKKQRIGRQRLGVKLKLLIVHSLRLLVPFITA